MFLLWTWNICVCTVQVHIARVVCSSWLWFLPCGWLSYDSRQIADSTSWPLSHTNTQTNTHKGQSGLFRKNVYTFRLIWTNTKKIHTHIAHKHTHTHTCGFGELFWYCSCASHEYFALTRRYFITSILFLYCVCCVCIIPCGSIWIHILLYIASQKRSLKNNWRSIRFSHFKMPIEHTTHNKNSRNGNGEKIESLSLSLN